MSQRLIGHRKFLASLNPSIERPFFVNLETTYNGAVAGATLAGVSYTVPSDKILVIYGVVGAMEIIPTAVGANFAEDTDVHLPDLITVQLTATPSQLTMFSVPTTLSQLVSTYKRPKPYWKLPAPWRLDPNDQITANYVARAHANWNVVQHRFGVSLVSELVLKSSLAGLGPVA